MYNRVVCPQDVKKVLLKQAKMVCWKSWAAKHACEELKEGVWLEPIQAVLRRKTNESWTDKHRNVMRKLVVEGWVQNRLYDIGWSDEKKQRLQQRGKARRSTGCTFCRHGNQIPEGLGNWERRAKTPKEDWKWQGGIASRHLSG